MRRLRIARTRPIVPNMRVRQHDDLPRIRWVGKNFLVSRQRGIENDLAYALHRRAESSAAKDAPILERQNCLHGISPWEWTLSILTGSRRHRSARSRRAAKSPALARLFVTSIWPDIEWP